METQQATQCRGSSLRDENGRGAPNEFDAAVGMQVLLAAFMCCHKGDPHTSVHAATLAIHSPRAKY
jgi:hypothetical protein